MASQPDRDLVRTCQQLANVKKPRAGEAVAQPTSRHSSYHSPQLTAGVPRRVLTRTWESAGAGRVWFSVASNPPSGGRYLIGDPRRPPPDDYGHSSGFSQPIQPGKGQGSPLPQPWRPPLRSVTVLDGAVQQTICLSPVRTRCATDVADRDMLQPNARYRNALPTMALFGELESALRRMPGFVRGMVSSLGTRSVPS